MPENTPFTLDITLKLTGRTRTPVFIVDGEVVPGFERERLERLLA